MRRCFSGITAGWLSLDWDEVTGAAGAGGAPAPVSQRTHKCHCASHTVLCHAFESVVCARRALATIHEFFIIFFTLNRRHHRHPHSGRLGSGGGETGAQLPPRAEAGEWEAVAAAAAAS